MKGSFEHFRQFGMRLEKEARATAKRYGVEDLAGPQGFTLVYLLNHQDNEVFIKDIERKAQISKSVASGLIKRMEKNGYIQVIPSLVDKRKKQVVLTDDGREAGQKVQVFIEEFHRRLFRGLTKEEVRQAVRVWRRIEENITQGEEDA
ncbi:MarR family winged helix-turn-helix transcriptional regulator [Streptococcus sp. DD13]|uniref:MarR family winged helix-turn-helix transcriptional regulator n=1 Tax=Streptococcus sp. DD13 TaxID=1777881 RepID=UPI0007974669|nr:MarR family transcriptional regulator [Streptococcus sp. DD13]KXT78139.1 Transcriptional regulator, MarR family [Streptococcus sp. DD13]